MIAFALSHSRTSLEQAHARLKNLREARSGLVIKKGFSAWAFCARLAALVQDIAREKMEALRLLLFVEHFEKSLRLEKRYRQRAHRLRLGAQEDKKLCPAHKPVCTPRRADVIGFVVLAALLRRRNHRPKI